LLRRIAREQYQAFLESHFNTAQACEQLGRSFLSVHFPGVVDPDISDPYDINSVETIIQERYVEPA
jgi:hypothetical protein